MFKIWDHYQYPDHYRAGQTYAGGNIERENICVKFCVHFFPLFLRIAVDNDLGLVIGG